MENFNMNTRRPNTGLRRELFDRGQAGKWPIRMKNLEKLSIRTKRFGVLSQHTLFTFVPILESTATADFLFPLAQSNYNLTQTFQKRNGIGYMFSLFVCRPATQTSQKMQR